MSSCPVIVFARAPTPGRTKTRLIPALGAEGAAALHRQLTRRALETALSARLGPVELHCDPSIGHSFFQDCARRFGVRLQVQVRGDLGLRMGHALRTALASARRALLIGTDCPALTVTHLQEAAQRLAAGDDAVFVPVEDGGYVLVGLTCHDPQVFADIPWGGSEVMVRTEARLEVLGWRWSRLETLWDLDRPEDLGRLSQVFPARAQQ